MCFYTITIRKLTSHIYLPSGDWEHNDWNRFFEACDSAGVFYPSGLSSSSDTMSRSHCNSPNEKEKRTTHHEVHMSCRIQEYGSESGSALSLWLWCFMGSLTQWSHPAVGAGLRGEQRVVSLETQSCGGRQELCIPEAERGEPDRRSPAGISLEETTSDSLACQAFHLTCCCPSLSPL